MRIHTDSNGLYVNSISHNSAGKDVDGQLYYVQAGTKTISLEFQRGSTDEGVNGITNEALLAVLIHRTQVLDSKLPCDQNKAAIAAMLEAAANFEMRTTMRLFDCSEAKDRV
jgi:hypothetical protein